jgi:general secretion pathway protein H
MRASAHGFTLLEVLVVVAIGAILAVLAVLRLGAVADRDDPAEQLQRLMGLLDAQCEQAMFQSRPRGMRITENGFDFWHATSEGWLPLAGDGIHRPRSWSGELVAELLIEGHSAPVDADLDGPQVTCQPLGELSPFELSLVSAGQRWRVTGRGDGRLELHRPR